MTEIKKEVQITRIEKYEYNGYKYDTLEEATEAKRRKEDPVYDYIKGQPSWRSYPLDQFGGWLIKDEGPVDFGSSGSAAVIAVFEGTFRDAVEYAVKLKAFRGYGWGSITSTEIVRKGN